MQCPLDASLAVYHAQAPSALAGLDWTGASFPAWDWKQLCWAMGQLQEGLLGMQTPCPAPSPGLWSWTALCSKGSCPLDGRQCSRCVCWPACPQDGALQALGTSTWAQTENPDRLEGSVLVFTLSTRFSRKPLLVLLEGP